MLGWYTEESHWETFTSTRSTVASKESEIRKQEDALASLYEESYGKVARYIFARIGNQQEAEDLASETFVRALKSVDSYQERGLPMEAWIFKIAHNLVVDYLRKMAKRKTVCSFGKDTTTGELTFSGDGAFESWFKCDVSMPN